MNPTKIILAIVGAVAALFAVDFIVRRAAGDIADTLDINEGTIFEDTGPVGVVGNITDKISGGLLSTFGSFVGLQGSKAFNFFKTGEFR